MNLNDKENVQHIWHTLAYAAQSICPLYYILYLKTMAFRLHISLETSCLSYISTLLHQVRGSNKTDKK